MTCRNFTCPVGTKPKPNPLTITCSAIPCKVDECCNSCRLSAFHHDLRSTCSHPFVLCTLLFCPCHLFCFFCPICKFFTTVSTSLPGTITCANYVCPTGFTQKPDPTSIICDSIPCKFEECCNRNLFETSFSTQSAEVFTVWQYLLCWFNRLFSFLQLRKSYRLENIDEEWMGLAQTSTETGREGYKPLCCLLKRLVLELYVPRGDGAQTNRCDNRVHNRSMQRRGVLQ